LEVHFQLDTGIIDAGCELAPYPTITRIFDECMKLNAFIDAQPNRQPDAA
jgi:hypothetical protein